MGEPVSTALYISAAATTFATYQSYEAQKEQAASSKKRYELESQAKQEEAKATRLKLERERQAAYAEQRTKQQGLAARREALGAGAAGTTAVGGEFSIATKGAARTGYFGQQAAIGENIFALQNRASEASAAGAGFAGEAAMWGAVGSTVGSIFEAKGGWKEVFKS